VPWHVVRLVARLVVDNFDYAAHPGASARRAARPRLLRLCRASGCLGTSRGSSSTTAPTPRVLVPQHVARLFTRLIVDYFASRRLVVDYFASRRLVVDYFAYAVRPGASTRRAACHAARRQLLRALRLRLAATLALLQPRRVSRLLVSQHWLYFEYAARLRDVIFWSHRVDHSSRLVF
jgi:hypothetical protein